MADLEKRLQGSAIGLDEAANALLGGGFRETLSGSTGRAAAQGKWWAVHIGQPFVNFVMRNPQHCQQAYADEEARRKALGTKNA